MTAAQLRRARELHFAARIISSNREVSSLESGNQRLSFDSRLQTLDSRLYRCIRREATLEFFGDGDGLEGIAAHGDENEVWFCDDLCFSFASHLEVKAQRFGADAPDV